VILTENLAARARYAGAAIVAGLRSIRSPLVTGIRGRGLLLGLALSIPASELSDALLERGVAAKETREHVLRIAPPLVIDDDEIAYLLERFAGALGSLQSHS
jgi:ornithine--oxo-acid transaminase